MSTDCSTASTASTLTTLFIGVCLPVFTFFGYTAYQKYRALQRSLATLNGLTYINAVASIAGQFLSFVSNQDAHDRTRSMVSQLLYRPEPNVHRAVNMNNLLRQLHAEPEAAPNNNDAANE